MTLKMRAVRLFETSGTTGLATQRFIARRLACSATQNLKSHKKYLFSMNPKIQYDVHTDGIFCPRLPS